MKLGALYNPLPPTVQLSLPTPRSGPLPILPPARNEEHRRVRSLTLRSMFPHRKPIEHKRVTAGHALRDYVGCGGHRTTILCHPATHIA